MNCLNLILILDYILSDLNISSHMPGWMGRGRQWHPRWKKQPCAHSFIGHGFTVINHYDFSIAKPSVCMLQKKRCPRCHHCLPDWFYRWLNCPALMRAFLSEKATNEIYSFCPSPLSFHWTASLSAPPIATWAMTTSDMSSRWSRTKSHGTIVLRTS